MGSSFVGFILAVSSSSTDIPLVFFQDDDFLSESLRDKLRLGGTIQ